MKLIYIGKEKFNNRYKSLFKSRQVETIHYKNPLKAIDNLEEIEPEYVVMVSGDFPRMWKIVLSEVKSFNSSIKFLLKADLDNESIKAFNFLKGDKFYSKEDEGLEFLKSDIHGESTNSVFYPENGEVTLGFMNPLSFSFVSGIVLEISNKHVLFKYDPDCDIDDLSNGDKVKDSTINFNDKVTNLDFEIKEIGETIKLNINNPNPLFEEMLSLLFV